MFTNTPKHIYTINLPSSVSKDVVEWFDIMENNDALTESIIELVHERLKSGKPLRAVDSIEGRENSFQSPQTGEIAEQNCFLDSLYNWQDANNAIFKDAGEPKKEKKRMLTV